MAAGIPNTNQILPFSREALQLKSKLGNPMELPGLFYSQYTPTAANCNTGTVTNSGASMIGALQKGIVQSGTTPWGGATIVTASSSTGLLITLSTAAAWLPTTLNYNDMPVQLVATAGSVLPTGVNAGQTYYWQWASSTTGKLALTPGGNPLAYVDAGSGTLYLLAATLYWGSPTLPAGFLQVSDTLNQATPSSNPAPGCIIHGEILGSITSAGTGNIKVDAGFNTAGDATNFTAMTSAGNVALTAVGPFPFLYTFDWVVQQYGQSSIAAPYTAAGRLRAVSELVVGGAATYSTAVAAAYNVYSRALWTSNTIDLTVPLTVDVRGLLGTPATGTYIEPLCVRLWAYN